MWSAAAWSHDRFPFRILKTHLTMTPKKQSWRFQKRLL
ncbi:hypothetical protein NOC27_1762 [Nitrosococcus oceani AFC27]|nr:hypothetical protein NOC27_1762 [Nitrosococcus oceani AFC27]